MICLLIELNEIFMDWFFIFVIDARFTSARWSGSVHLHIWVCSIWKKKFNFSPAGTKFYNFYKIFVQFISAAIKEDFFLSRNKLRYESAPSEWYSSADINWASTKTKMQVYFFPDPQQPTLEAKRTATVKLYTTSTT